MTPEIFPHGMWTQNRRQRLAHPLLSFSPFHMGIWKRRPQRRRRNLAQFLIPHGDMENLNTQPPRDTMEIYMVCEFLSTEYKKKLLEIADIGELMAIGYTKKSAYNVRELGVISDERCEKLVTILGVKARPVLIQALREFASKIGCQVNCP